MARELGADAAAETSKFGQMVMDETRGRGVDVVVDAAAALRDDQSVDRDRADWRAGGADRHSERTELNVDMHGAMAKELNIQTIRRSNHNSHGALDADGIGAHRRPHCHAPSAALEKTR